MRSRLLSLPLVDLVRVAYGLHFAWYLHSFLKLAPLHADPAGLSAYAWAGIAVSLALAVGFLTPLCLFTLALGFHGFFADRIGWNLCHGFGALIAWGLWLRGAGRRASVDAWLGNVFAWWPTSPEDSQRSRARSADTLIFLAWITFALGAAHHLSDPRWRDGTALGKLLTDPFLSAGAGALSTILTSWPGVGEALKGISWLALFGELFLWPLSRLPRGSIAAALVLAGFSAFAALGLQAGPVGGLALCLLVLLFAPAPQGAASDHAASAFTRVARPVGIVFAGLSLALEFLGVSALRPLLPPLMPLARAFGLASPRVYNGWEIDGGAFYFTIRGIEGGEKAPPSYVLPSGGRGPDLSNPSLYFDHYGRWYRLAPGQKWKGGPTPWFQDVYRRAVSARRLLEPADRAELFEVDVFHRKTSLAGTLPVWSEPERIARFRWNDRAETATP